MPIDLINVRTQKTRAKIVSALIDECARYIGSGHPGFSVLTARNHTPVVIGSSGDRRRYET